VTDVGFLVGIVWHGHRGRGSLVAAAFGHGWLAFVQARFWNGRPLGCHWLFVGFDVRDGEIPEVGVGIADSNSTVDEVFDETLCIWYAIDAELHWGIGIGLS
jgi:hypothetical protein